MKLIGVLLLCTFVTALPTVVEKIDLGIEIPDEAVATTEGRNTFIDILIRLIRVYIRFVVKNGSAIFGFPPLDPLVVDKLHLNLPLGLINLDLDVKDAEITGIGGIVVRVRNFVPRELSFDLDITVPSFVMNAEHYDLIGDILNALPLYGTGHTRFQVDDFRMRGTIILKQSEDGRSVIIDKVINSSYEIPFFKSDVSGVIGGGDIDDVINAVFEDVVIDYANRFQGAIAALVSYALPLALNPALNLLDTWKYIEIFA